MIFNLNAHTVHFKIVNQTLEIWVRKVKVRNALETRGFAKGLAIIWYHGDVLQEFSSLTFCFTFEKNYTLKCSSCSWNNFPFEESARALHSIQRVICIKEEATEHMHANFWDVAWIHHFYHNFSILIQLFVQFYYIRWFSRVFPCSKTKNCKLKFTCTLENVYDTNHGYVLFQNLQFLDAL